MKGSVLHSKGLAMRDGLVYALNKGFSKVVVEGDSKIIIDCINGKSCTPWRLKSVVYDIWTIASSCEIISFKHILCEANFTADVLVKASHVSKIV